MNDHALYESSPIIAHSWHHGIPSIRRRASGKNQRAQGLDSIRELNAHFKRIWLLYFTAFIACAFCGTVCLGKDSFHSDNFHSFDPSNSQYTSPPILQQSPQLRNHIYTEHPITGCDCWWQCQNCQTQSHAQSHVIAYARPYLNALFASSAHALQKLSVIDVGTLLAESLNGYAEGTMRRMSYISGAIVAMDATSLYALTESQIQELVSIISSNLMTNPIMQAYQTMFERFDADYDPLSMLPSGCLGNMIRHQMERSPVVNVRDPTSFRFASLQNADITLAQLQPTELLNLGTRYLRNEMEPRTFTVDTVGIAAINDDNDDQELFSTFEYAMFPFLFPIGHGFYRGRRTRGFTLQQYLRYRMTCLFSVFTLHPQYLLLMHQLHTAHRIMSSITETVIIKEIQKLRKTYPNLPEPELFAMAAKHKVCPTVPGSPKYYQANLRHLLNKVHSEGMPSLFLTLTMDEVSNIRWSEVDNAEEFLNSFTAGKTFRDMPVEMTSLFHRKIIDFMREYILPTDFTEEHGILGNVTGYMIRYELQMRGSPHAHIVLWLHPDDQERVGAEIMAHVPATYNARTETWVPPLDPNERELFDLVLRKQQHPCSPPGFGCRATKNKRCKYGYPCAVCEELNHYSERVRAWVYKRPFVPHSTGENPHSMNERIVPYHPTILLLWKAHMNLQVVTREAWSFYLLKYATKCEPSCQLNLDADLARSIGMHQGDAACTEFDEITLKFISGVALTRPVCPAEAALDLLQIPNIHFDTNFVEVHLFPPDQRKRYSNNGTKPLLASVDSYMGRSSRHDAMTCFKYFDAFQVSPSRLPKKTAISNLISGTSYSQPKLVGQDVHGRFVYERHPAQIVGFTDFNPINNSEGFFYLVLLRNIAFRDENTLISNTNVSRTYIEECRIRGHFRSEEDVIDLLASYASFHLYGEHQCGKLLAKLMAKYPLDPPLPLDGIDFHPLPIIPPIAPSTSDVINAEFQCLDDIVMNVDQQIAFDAITHTEGGVHILEGAPGSGKSFVTKKLIRHYDSLKTTISINASTGAAASRLSERATTCHAGFGLNGGGSFLRLISPESDIFFTLYYAKVIFIDEFSMLTSDIVNFILYRLCQVYNTTVVHEVLLRVKIILIGDSLQLPAVCRHVVDADSVCQVCRINKSTLWPLGIRHLLTTVVRHANDLDFLNFLHIIRVRKPTQAEIDATLSACVVNDDELCALLSSNDPNFQVLTSHRNVAQDYNDILLHQSFPDEPIINLPLHTSTTDTNYTAVADWLADTKFHTLHAFKIGCRIILLENLDLAKGASNGATGIVLSAHYRSDVLNKIVVQLDNGVVINIMRTRTAYKYIGAYRYYKSTFPLSLGRALTGHRSQGATIASTVLVHVTEAFCPGLLYVILSRVTERRFLRIYGNFTPNDFVPVPPML